MRAGKELAMLGDAGATRESCSDGRARIVKKGLEDGMKPGLEPEVVAKEESLDPHDWAAMRKLGHRMVDEMMSHLETVRERPAWQPIPESVKQSLGSPVPLEPRSPEAVYEEFRRDVLPYPLGNIHPRFWGWVIGTGTPFG